MNDAVLPADLVEEPLGEGDGEGETLVKTLRLSVRISTGSVALEARCDLGGLERRYSLTGHQLPSLRSRVIDRLQITRGHAHLSGPPGVRTLHLGIKCLVGAFPVGGPGCRVCARSHGYR